MFSVSSVPRWLSLLKPASSLRWMLLTSALVVVLFVSPASAHHPEGQISLWVSDIQLESTQDGLRIVASLVERDEGTVAPGFGILVEAENENRQIESQVELLENASAQYEGFIELGSGEWVLIFTAHEGPSSLPVIRSSRQQSVTIDETGILVEDEGSNETALVFAIVVPIVVILVLLIWRSKVLRRDSEGGKPEHRTSTESKVNGQDETTEHTSRPIGETLDEPSCNA